ncbi:hypothetical protein RI367_005127 [Sorochytrium milnesiophthora]
MTNSTSKMAGVPGSGIRASAWTYYLYMLATRPVLTKSMTSAVLNLLQELISGTVVAASKVDYGQLLMQAAKMTAYGFCISGPMGHFLYQGLAAVFAGQTGPLAMVGQLLGANLVLAPIQNAVYLSAMSLAAGRNPFVDVPKGLLPLMKITWMVFPVVQLVAAKFLPQQLWTPFFNLVSFVFSLYVNVMIKRSQQRRKRVSGTDAKKSS